MDYLLNIKIEPLYLLIILIVLLVTTIIVMPFYCRGKISKVQLMAWSLLITYVFTVFLFTVFLRDKTDRYRYKLIPLWSYVEILKGNKTLLLENSLNVLLLMPEGMLLPAALGKKLFKKRFKVVVIIGTISSSLIEFLQLVLKCGFFEFDDIFHNTIGIIIGYGIYNFFQGLKSG